MKSFGILFLLLGWTAVAEDFPSSDTSAADFEKGFGGDTSISEGEKGRLDDSRLRIGGSLALDFFDLGTKPRDYLWTDSTLTLYGDARLKNDVRAFIKARGNLSSADPALSQTASSGTKSDIEELKLSFDASKLAFFTVGRQKIKWGVGKFWNPSDMVNQQRRDLLYTDDRRTGPNLLKAHVPVGSGNLYYVGSFEGATRFSELGHFGRIEWPLSTAEVALSAGRTFSNHPVFSADLSMALWDFDVYGEAGYSKGSNQTFYGPTGAFEQNEKQTLNWVSGLSYEFKYSDVDSAVINVEYFRNSDGYKGGAADYVWVLAAGAYSPFYLGQDYLLVLLSLNQPGTWNDTSFSLLNVANLNDHSYLSKLNMGIALKQDIALNFGLTARLGESVGEFRLGDLSYLAESRLQVDF